MRRLLQGFLAVVLELSGLRGSHAERIAGWLLGGSRSRYDEDEEDYYEETRSRVSTRSSASQPSAPPVSPPQPREEAIAVAIQSGNTVAVMNQKGEALCYKTGQLLGYTSQTFTVKIGNVAITFNRRGEQVGRAQPVK